LKSTKAPRGHRRDEGSESIMSGPTKLYKAIFGFEIYVLATDRDDAWGVAGRNAERELSDRGPYTLIEDVAEVDDVRRVDPDWLAREPYATKGNPLAGLTCEAAIAAIKAERRRADLPGQRKLFEET
jgi:hypothetical protein